MWKYAITFLLRIFTVTFLEKSAYKKIKVLIFKNPKEPKIDFNKKITLAEISTLAR